MAVASSSNKGFDLILSNQDTHPMDKTFALIKPDAYPRREAIIEDIKKCGFTILKQSEPKPTKEQFEEFYAEHKERHFFNDLVAFMQSGPIVAMVLQKENAVPDWRKTIGPTNSLKAKEEAPESLRAKYGTDGQANACHGSANDDDAKREIEFCRVRYLDPLHLRHPPDIHHSYCCLTRQSNYCHSRLKNPTPNPYAPQSPHHLTEDTGATAQSSDALFKDITWIITISGPEFRKQLDRRNPPTVVKLKNTQKVTENPPLGKPVPQSPGNPRISGEDRLSWTEIKQVERALLSILIPDVPIAPFPYHILHPPTPSRKPKSRRTRSKSTSRRRHPLVRTSSPLQSIQLQPKGNPSPCNSTPLTAMSPGITKADQTQTADSVTEVESKQESDMSSLWRRYNQECCERVDDHANHSEIDILINLHPSTPLLDEDGSATLSKPPSPKPTSSSNPHRSRKQPSRHPKSQSKVNLHKSKQFLDDDDSDPLYEPSRYYRKQISRLKPSKPAPSPATVSFPPAPRQPLRDDGGMGIKVCEVLGRRKRMGWEGWNGELARKEAEFEDMHSQMRTLWGDAVGGMGRTGNEGVLESALEETKTRMRRVQAEERRKEEERRMGLEDWRGEWCRKEEMRKEKKGEEGKRRTGRRKM
ncbi:putative Nucleoside diphosphate kinase [Blattamonas nauphoetae]|uniref:Nucleoside diphosphate kinase n=1 Tax=Blattamonas nauphoetae TaxID=2049346 RepID=A0ABQ9XRI5_9EUKA|nr:putative Nucleoside diphosphate kinase [Blattamonas nauphoetae]